jgi:hypothetical protein
MAGGISPTPNQMKIVECQLQAEVQAVWDIPPTAKHRIPSLPYRKYWRQPPCSHDSSCHRPSLTFVGFTLRLVFCLLFLGLTGFRALAQESDSLQISLLTCDPGGELYSTFGHSALRVKNFTTSDDWVFNYGTFNFGEKNFYLKFLRGKLLYQLSVSSMENFLYSYFQENRTVYEQVLYLNQSQQQDLLQALIENRKPENRSYQYDFFWDNCSTRIRDQLEKTVDSIQYPGRHTRPFRSYLHDYLTNQPWSQFGIDLILGLPCDHAADTREAMFLPLEMMEIYDSSRYQGRPLFSKSVVIQAANPNRENKSYVTPLVISLCILGVSFFWWYTRRGSGWFYGLFFLTGLAGIIIFFLWFLSDHITTKNNLHFIWANPLTLLFPWRSKVFPPALLQKLTRVYQIGLILLIGTIGINPQTMPLACVPIWIALWLGTLAPPAGK